MGRLKHGWCCFCATQSACLVPREHKPLDNLRRPPFHRLIKNADFIIELVSEGFSQKTNCVFGSVNNSIAHTFYSYHLLSVWG